MNENHDLEIFPTLSSPKDKKIDINMNHIDSESDYNSCSIYLSKYGYGKNYRLFFAIMNQ